MGCCRRSELAGDESRVAPTGQPDEPSTGLQPCRVSGLEIGAQETDEVGQLHELSDNHDLYLARIEVARKSVVSFRILEKLDAPPPTVHVSLAAALIKFDRFEWIVEKATELGVERILPVETTRTEKGLFEASRKRAA